MTEEKRSRVVLRLQIGIGTEIDLWLQEQAGEGEAVGEALAAGLGGGYEKGDLGEWGADTVEVRPGRLKARGGRFVEIPMGPRLWSAIVERLADSGDGLEATVLKTVNKGRERLARKKWRIELWRIRHESAVKEVLAPTREAAEKLALEWASDIEWRTGEAGDPEVVECQEVG